MLICLIILKLWFSNQETTVNHKHQHCSWFIVDKTCASVLTKDSYRERLRRQREDGYIIKKCCVYAVLPAWNLHTSCYTCKLPEKSLLFSSLLKDDVMLSFQFWLSPTGGALPMRQFARRLSPPPLPEIWSENNRINSITKEICIIIIDSAPPPPPKKFAGRKPDLFITKKVHSVHVEALSIGKNEWSLGS